MCKNDTLFITVKMTVLLALYTEEVISSFGFRADQQY